MKAFPIDYNTASIDKWQGMDLRDYFAAKAMPYLLRRKFLSFYNKGNYETNYPEIAQISYEMADAMMKAREQ